MHSIQENIARALSISTKLSNKLAQSALQAAQQSMKLAGSAKDYATRACYLAQAKQALIAANNPIASLGYGKAILAISATINANNAYCELLFSFFLFL